MAAWLSTRHGSDATRGVGITVHRLAASVPGPRVVVLGGIHGDETQGVRAALAVRDAVQELVAGSLVIVPVSHEAALAAGTRTSPLDGRNLARSFPGDPEGDPTERVAELLDRTVLADADVLIDLHSSGIHYAMPLLVGVCDDGSDASVRARALAEVAGLPVTWRHPGPPPPGRTGTGPHARGVPFVYLESSEATDEATRYRDAVLRMLGHLGVVSPRIVPAPEAPSRRLEGPGDLDALAVRAGVAGLCEVHVGLLDEVRGGQVVATQVDPWDGSVRPLVATSAGVVVMHRTTRWALPEDLVVFLTGGPVEGRPPPAGTAPAAAR